MRLGILQLRAGIKVRSERIAEIVKKAQIKPE
jgi:hypothetical protein